MYRRTAIIGVGLVLLSAAAVLAPAAGAKKLCPIQYCTDSTGKYVLEVPPLTTNPLLAAYADCVWKASVDFGDGSGQVYEFDAAVGLTGSHVFPTPGTTYTVQVRLREGLHANSKEFCPDYDQAEEVRFRTPAEEADDPPPVDPEDEEEPEPAPPGKPIPETVVQIVAAALTPPAAEPTSHWTRCRGGVLTHLVGCRKGREVARTARGRLSRPGTAQASGFSCHLPRGSAPSIVCRRGEQAVLAPPRGRR